MLVVTSCDVTFQADKLNHVEWAASEAYSPNFKYEIILLNERGDMRTTAQQIPTMQKYNDMIPVHELQQ